MKKNLYDTHYFLYEIECIHNDYNEVEEFDVLDEQMVEKYIYKLEEIIKNLDSNININKIKNEIN